MLDAQKRHRPRTGDAGAILLRVGSVRVFKLSPDWCRPFTPMQPPKQDTSQANHSPLRVTQILHALTVGRPEDRLSVGMLRHEFGERAFGLLLFVFALPNCLPMPGIPGVSMVTGLPVVFFALQLAIGRSEPYLPAWIRDRTFTRGQLSHFIVKANPWLTRIEALIRPRLSIVTTGLAERLLGIVALLLAIALSLPIPFGNLMPAIALALIALAMIERDGLLVIAGYVASALACVWLTLLYLGAEGVLRTIFHWA